MNELKGKPRIINLSKYKNMPDNHQINSNDLMIAMGYISIKSVFKAVLVGFLPPADIDISTMSNRNHEKFWNLGTLREYAKLIIKELNEKTNGDEKS